MKFQLLIEQCDSDIRQGRSERVPRLLAGLNSARVKREYRLPLAKICRRVGLYSLGIRLLSQVIHSARNHNALPATNSEIAEYAVLLIRIDAVNEALQKLQLIDPNQVPEALLYRAFAHFANWECAAAIPVLRQYLQTPLAFYDRVVAQVNLAYALVECGEAEQAFPLLAENIAITTEHKYSKLLSVCYVYRARLHIQSGDLGATERDLIEAHQALEAGHIFDHQLINKWNHILLALKTKSQTPLSELRSEALLYRSWEDLREADFFSLKLHFDPKRFDHLIFGTRFPDYRDRICRELNHQPQRQVLLLGETHAPSLDLRDGRIDSSRALTPGRKSHQMLEVLFRDFYLPSRVGSLFHELFPGEHFDIFSSADRVHQILRRTRRWLETNQVPLQIEERGGFYSVHITGHFAVKVSLQRQPVEALALSFDRLASAMGRSRIFTGREAVQALKISKQTFQRIVNWGLEHGRIERLGRSATTKYKIAQQNETLNKAS